MIGDDTARELLRIVASFGGNGCSHAEFATKAYASSPHWKRPPRRRGGQRGGVVMRSAAGVLGRLKSRGFVEKTADQRYGLTERGRAFMTGGGAVAAQAETLAQLPNDVVRPPAQWVASVYSPTGWAWWDGCCGHWMPDAFGNLAYYMPLTS